MALAPTRLLTAGDRAAGGLARGLSTVGQLGLLALGTHLAADHLDDLAHTGLSAFVSACERWLAKPLWGLAETVGLSGSDLWFWDVLPLEITSTALALAVELTAFTLLATSFLLTPRDGKATWAAWRSVLGIQAVVLPFVLAGVLAAGSWSLSMAIEDLLPPGTWSRPAAAVVGVAAGFHYGLGAWSRAVATLDPPDRWSRGLFRAVVLLPVGVLAWFHGLPLWGWLP